ncbi:MAG: DivIVA domain-containing protein, partial [Vicinamibacterales bacterium]
MKLTPVQPRFRTAWRGYDRSEVDAFVRQLAQQYEATIQGLQECLAERDHDTDRVQTIGQTLEQWLESVIPALTGMQTA